MQGEYLPHYISGWLLIENKEPIGLFIDTHTHTHTRSHVCLHTYTHTCAYHNAEETFPRGGWQPNHQPQGTAAATTTIRKTLNQLLYNPKAQCFVSLCGGSQRGATSCTASSPGNLLEMQLLEPIPDLLNQKFGETGPKTL